MKRRTVLRLGVGLVIGLPLLSEHVHAADEEQTVRLDRAFEDGRPFEIRNEPGRLRPQTIAHLVVTSGHLIVGDGIIWSVGMELARKIPPGQYPVDVSVAEFLNGDRWVAYERVLLSDGKPVRWEHAAPVGRALSDLKPDEYYGYPVDSGTGSFVDRDVVRSLDALPEKETVAFTDATIDTLNRNPGLAWQWADMTVDSTTGGNLVAFTSGFGDGNYPSYWGLGEDDGPVCLVTDFSVVD